MTPFYLLFRREAIVVARWHVHRELCRAAAWSHGLRDAADIVDLDLALYLFASLEAVDNDYDDV